MTIGELDSALFNQRPVMVNVIMRGEFYYDRVSSILKKNIEGKPKYSAELYNVRSNSTLIAEPAAIRYATDEEIKALADRLGI